MTPYYEHGGVVIYHGDCLAIMPELPAASVDAMVADPPYSSGGLHASDRMRDVHAKYVQADSRSGAALPGFTGDSRDQRGFFHWVALWVGLSRRLVVEGGIAGLFCDWRQLPITTDAVQAGGYTWRGVVPWWKPAARPQQGRWTNACEYLVWGTNGARPLAGGGFPGFFRASAPSARIRRHIAEKPVDMLAEILAIVPKGGCILDPFTGSGSTLVAAARGGHRAIGIEIEERYCEVAASRLTEESANCSHSG